jgi:deoxycytidine triphosphate deaminase
MPTILSDIEIKRLLGTVIVDGDVACIRPNAYVLRLGAKGEFLNTGKEFDISSKTKGLRIQPGHSVGVTAYETLDFTRDTVHKIYPGKDLHAIVSPTTDLSREGIVAPTTQVDAGFFGTLNWTFTNTSSEERRFILKERIYRITIYRLEDGETPEHLYTGDYQSQTGYVRSKRTGPPVGMKESEWEDGQVKGGPQDLLENLIRSGYPWNILGSRLKEIDLQFKAVTDEYAEIDSSIKTLTGHINAIRERQNDTPDTVRRILREEADSLQNRWLISAGASLLGLIGLAIALMSNATALQFIKDKGILIGLALIIIAVAGVVWTSRRK